MGNKEIFESPSVVDYYASFTELQRPEKTIADILGSKLSNMTMLDIGIGGGRTTYSFAPAVKLYLGVDYAKNMVEVCRKKFQHLGEHVEFRWLDIATIDSAKYDRCFDFVLFSFNGLDCMAHEERIQSLRNIHRVTKRGGYFAFSAHNMQCVDGLLPIVPAFQDLKRVVRWVLYRVMNPSLRSEFNKLPYVVLKDTAFRGRFKSYYVRPEEQIRQLGEAGFRNIRLFELHSGKEIFEDSVGHVKDCWIYYLCNT